MRRPEYGRGRIGGSALERARLRRGCVPHPYSYLHPYPYGLLYPYGTPRAGVV